MVVRVVSDFFFFPFLFLFLFCPRKLVERGGGQRRHERGEGKKGKEADIKGGEIDSTGNQNCLPNDAVISSRCVPPTPFLPLSTYSHPRSRGV